MKLSTGWKLCAVIAVSATVGSLTGCASWEVNNGHGNAPGYYVRTELQDADRAVEAARAAGKDKTCPAEFKEAEAAKNKAYDVYRACHTEEAVALAKEATAKANALCPPRPAPASSLRVNPAAIAKGQAATLTWSSENSNRCTIDPGVGSVPPQGSVTVTPAASTSYLLTCSGEGGSATSSADLSVSAPPPTAPRPVAPTAQMNVSPASIIKGDRATLSWSSKNASNCEIQPEVGPVPPQGSMPVTPGDDTAYTLICNGDGGTAKSAAKVAVAAPVAAPVAVPKAAATKLCSPTVIDVRFDTNKWNIKPQYHAELKKLADFLAEFPNAKGVIEGHTDNVGDAAANLKLSQRRADSVRKYLIDKFGVAPERIKAEGYGETRPLADNKTKAGKAQNRRIQSNFTCD